MATRPVNLMDSAIPQMVQINMRERADLNWWPERTGDIYNVFFTALATYLKRNSSKKNKYTGVALRSSEGKFLIGGILGYESPEEEDADDDKGNFNLVFVLDESDWKEHEPEIDNLLTDYEREYFVQCEHDSNELANGRWKDVRLMWCMLDIYIDTLKQFITENLSQTPDDIIEVTMPNIFTAAGAIEDGEVVISVTPGGTIKQLIKSDIIL